MPEFQGTFPSEAEVLLRLGLAVLMGLVVGYERESRGRAAGLRTTMLACVAACVAMLLSTHLHQYTPGNGWRPDPARLGASVLAGMGFLGAGAIIREGNSIRGVTTAAVLWYVTILGLCFGAGFYLLGLLASGIAFIALFLIPPLGGWIANDWYGVVTVVLDATGPSDATIRDTINATGVRVKKTDLHYQLLDGRRTLRFDVKYKKTDLFEVSQRVTAALKAHRGVIELSWA